MGICRTFLGLRKIYFHGNTLFSEETLFYFKFHVVLSEKNMRNNKNNRIFKKTQKKHGGVKETGNRVSFNSWTCHIKQRQNAKSVFHSVPLGCRQWYNARSFYLSRCVCVSHKQHQQKHDQRNKVISFSALRINRTQNT